MFFGIQLKFFIFHVYLSFVSPGITYTISSGDRYDYFTIGVSSGEIRTVKTLDHDEVPSFLLNIQADTSSTHLFGTTQVSLLYCTDSVQQ